jgi:hypothetical protein
MTLDKAEDTYFTIGCETEGHIGADFPELLRCKLVSKRSGYIIQTQRKVDCVGFCKINITSYLMLFLPSV